jgi:hypothetical protein
VDKLEFLFTCPLKILLDASGQVVFQPWESPSASPEKWWWSNVEQAGINATTLIHMQKVTCKGEDVCHM